MFALIVFASYSVGYAYFSTILNTTGTLSVKTPSESIKNDINITNVTYLSNIDADTSNSYINGYTNTTLNSRVVLSSSNTNSSITYRVTVNNCGTNKYKFDGAVSATHVYFYDNSDITYTLSGITTGDEIVSGDSITFTITFKYVDNVTIDNNILNSFINFKFSKVNASVVYGTQKLVDLASTGSGGSSSNTDVITVSNSEVTSCTYTFAYDGHSNLRYVGGNPCNYIYFNGTNWRIIGVFNDKGDNSLLKIVNMDNPYSNSIAFNSSSSTNNGKLWGNNTLATTLNSTYYSNLQTNDFSKYIKSVNWFVGGPTANTNTPTSFYNSEISTLTTNVYNIGLYSVSDFGFATDVRDSNCLSKNMSSWNKTTCLINHDWMYVNDSKLALTISTVENRNYIYRLTYAGIPYNVQISSEGVARETLYLLENVIIYDGDGSSTNPYKIKL